MTGEIINARIDELVPHPDNPRRGDIPAIMRSLERFGQMKPIVVQRSTNYVVAGNHTMQAAKQLGWSTIEAVFEDLDDESARAYLIADNRTSDRAHYDTSKLTETLLNGLVSLEGTGFTQDDLDSLRESGRPAAGAVGGEAAREPLVVQSVALEDDPETAGESPREGEPMREVVMLMKPSQISTLTEQVNDLQGLWPECRTVVDVLTRSLKEAHERWQAGAAKAAARDSDSLPFELVGGDF